jgi:hypothetical protein
MGNGNARQSAWSDEFHAGRGDVPLPCPAAELGGHWGTCREVHPRGIVVDAAGRWRAVPAFNPDDMMPSFVEHYA